MEHQIWQPVPGLDDGIIYSYIRKPDVISSNSYIIAFPRQIILIDPGGLPDQAAVLAEEVRLQVEKENRPVFVYLTHSHLDHCLQLMHSTEMRDAGTVSIISHEKAADALEGKDPRATTADLMGHEMSSLKIAVRLFCEGTRDRLPERQSHAGPLECSVANLIQPVRPGVDLWTQTVTCPEARGITCYHTPGHSPDSISIQVGSILFCGDLLFATSPGVAGLHGWDHRELIASVEKVLWLLDHGGIQYCYPGHGRVLDVETARKILHGLQKEAESLAGIKPITPERVHMMASDAADILAEVDRLFTIVAGRLLFVSHVLDELEEAGEAKRLRGLIDADSIDGLLADFNRFSQGYHAGDRREIHVALKAGQITAKLARSVDQGCLAEIIDPSFIHRATQLIEDYSLTFRGFEPVSSPSQIVPAELIRAGVDAIHRTPFDDEAILLADDDEAYLRALIARIAHVNPLERMECTIEGDQELSCIMDSGRFTDIFRSLLERCSVAGVSQVSLRLTRRDGIMLITFSAPGESMAEILSTNGERFINRSVLLCGGSVLTGDTGCEAPLVLAFPGS